MSTLNRNPDKPHPDVEARLKIQGAGEIGEYAGGDEVVTDVPKGQLLKALGGVHVMISVAGFEALLFGLPVTCYGLPFYAGWSLSQDQISHPRRTHGLTLDKLLVWRAKVGGATPWWRQVVRAFLRRIIGAR